MTAMPAHSWRVAGVLSLLAMCASGWTQDTPAEWGDIWRPVLPDGEKHPSLFYDDGDRATMAGRLGQEPWKTWWAKSSSARVSPAVRWWLLGDEDAAKRCRDDLVGKPIWRQEPQGYLEPSSHRFADYVCAYDVLAAWPGLTADDHKVIRDRIAAEADYYYKVMDSVPGGANYGNQRTLGCSALGMAALTLCEYTDSPIGPRRWLQRALYEIRRDENFWFFRPGGLFVEGLGYTSYMNVQFVPFAIAYERASGKFIFDDPRLREWLTFACYQLMNNAEYVFWGTCEAGSGLSWLALLCNERYGKDLAPLFAHTFGLSPDPWTHPYHIHIALSVHDPDAGGDPPPPSRVFPESQTAVLREDWGHETVAVWFAGKDGTWPLAHRYGTYSHGDASHFVLAAWDEVLAADSGYDHWKSRDYYGAEFHNVVLIDGKGPAQDTPGTLSQVSTEGPVRHARVTTEYGGCKLRRTLALIRGRYVLVVDVIEADGEHEYTWQVRSTCPPDTPGTDLAERAVTWSGLSASGWRKGEIGKTQLTTVIPPFAELALATGRWRPMSGQSEFINQVALAKWSAAGSSAMFALLPNLKDAPDLSWEALDGQNLRIIGPDWEDRATLDGDTLTITGSDGKVQCRLALRDDG